MRAKPPSKKADPIDLDAFAEKFDTLVSIFRDPVEFLFEVMADPNNDTDLRVRTAEILVAYRYPKLKALENKAPQTGPMMQFNITMTAPPEQPEQRQIVDINPMERKAS